MIKISDAKMDIKNILVTGAAGFIGFHLINRLTQIYPNSMIHGIDNVNSYYDVGLKESRLNILKQHPQFKFYRLDLADRAGIEKFFSETKPEIVLHMGAQAGVRYSIDNPYAYIDSNIIGFQNIIEGCRHSNVCHLLYASSSSVYGANKKVPFSTSDFVDNPVSLYAATKKSNELVAHAYAHLYKIPMTGLRFFTVYGPWGRPDMAYFKFVKSIYENKPIDVYNYGDMKRDFTYVDDIVEGIIRLIPLAPTNNTPPYSIYNIGNNNPEDLGYMINVLENLIGKKAERNLLPMQPGDVYATYADVEPLERVTGFKPVTKLEVGLEKFVDWYKGYYKL